MSHVAACASCGHPSTIHLYEADASIPCRSHGCSCARYIWPGEVSVRFRLKGRGRWSHLHRPARPRAGAAAQARQPRLERT